MSEDVAEKSADASDKTARPTHLSSQDLLAGYREVIIEHGTEHYRLRLTNSNKLILVK